MIERRTADSLTAALAAVGLLIAGYLTALHYYSSVPLVCSAGSLVNCETVLTSPSATVAGLPVAVWGLVWFGVAVTLSAIVLVRDGVGGGGVRTALLAWTVAATVGVLYLVYQEVGVIGKICLWCTALHAIILAMLILESATYSEYRRSPAR